VEAHFLADELHEEGVGFAYGEGLGSRAGLDGGDEAAGAGHELAALEGIGGVSVGGDETSSGPDLVHRGRESSS